MNSLTLQSPDGRFFRRIWANGNFEAKVLGMPWQPHEPPYIEPNKVAGYVETMTKKLRWKLTKTP